MDTFTAVLLGVISIVGFLLQVKDYFPQYKYHILCASFLTMGIAIGVVVRTFAPATVTFAYPITVRELLGTVVFGTWGLLCITLYATSLFHPEAERRSDAKAMGSTTCFWFVWIFWMCTSNFYGLPAGAIALAPEESISLAKHEIIANRSSRATEILKAGLASLPVGDRRREPLNKLLDEATTASTNVDAIEASK